ncbi:unconventional myosin-Va isoform X2 [Nematostella vectensis]|uniref:unconventional myosin-Va isoform X2 n=1 Tax=Nematostella vectensis TaxID=45351 RepID=UPI00207739FD|nr:unconventional myosin-Va isoform X2 [Nematostella vectensis]
MKKGARVWIPHPDLVWIGGELTKDIEDKILEILLEDGREIIIDTRKSRLPPLRNPEILVGENDLTTLSYLHEPAVLHNLNVRFIQSNAIYTYCGIVLVAINPYEELPLYGPDIVAAYRGRSMGDMDPHIFAVAEDAFQSMIRDERNQSVIVSGESGAGKTVSAKYAMRYFSAVGGASTETQIEKKVIATNPIMEAIGNAKTIRNDNSSRFGKYLEISFDRNHHIIGAHMRTYLLEKSRVVFQAAEERNYHVFYQMCAACELPEMKDFRLAHPDNFSYLNQGDAPVVDSIDDADCFEELREALSMVGINDDEQLMLFRILSAILHLGNVEILQAGDDECTVEENDFHLEMTAVLLGIDKNQLRKWLCNRKIVTVGEVLIKPLSITEANYGREAISKRIYSQLFKWVVNTINCTLTSTSKPHSFIGVLDIYGFETFEINSFEQFCINYANEKLQQQFTQHVFKLEQDEYVREEIQWSFINFYDNQPCIDLIEAKLGILDLLDEECKMPKGSDSQWAQKLYKQHLQKSKHFSKPRMSNLAFVIHHFADHVEYFVSGFVEKNRDTVNDEHLALLRASEYDLVSEVIQCMDRDEMVGEMFTENDAHSAPRKRAASRAGKQGGKGGKMFKSVGSQFSVSLSKLMETLNSTTPHYVRCIKPNDTKAPFEFHPKRSIQQLRACGVLETIRISAAGYPSRWTYREFFARYIMLLPSKKINRKKPRETIKLILETFIKDEDMFQMGKTKIFFRAGQVAYLEKLRGDKLRRSCVMIQKNYRCYREHKLYLRMRKAAILIQAWVRGDQARNLARSLRRNKSATTIQRYYRGFHLRQAYLRKHAAILTIQSYARGMSARRQRQVLLYNAKAGVIQRCWRGYKGRQKYRNYFKKIIFLQSCVRRMRARKELKKLKIEARSVEHFKALNKGMENKIIELQQRLDQEVKKKEHAQAAERDLSEARKELDEARKWKGHYESSSARLVEMELVVSELRDELKRSMEARERVEKEAKEEIEEKDEEIKSLRDVIEQLREQVAEANSRAADEVASRDATLDERLEEQRVQILSEFEAERLNHQRVLRDYSRLEQRYQNLQDELEIVQTSPQKPLRSLDSVSTASSETSLVDALEKELREQEAEEPDEVRSIITKSQLFVRLRSKVMDLENRLVDAQSQLNKQSGETSAPNVPSIKVEEGDAWKQKTGKLQEIMKERDALKEEKEKVEAEQKKMGSELVLLRKLVSQRNVDKEAEWDLISEKMKEIKDDRDLLEREKERLRKQLIDMASVAKDLREIDELLKFNPDESAYVLQAESLKKANNVLQIELEELIKKEKSLKEANENLWRDKAKLQKGRTSSVHAMDSSFQQEVTRLVTENVDLREQVERLEKENATLRKDQSSLMPFRGRAQSMKADLLTEQKRRSHSVWAGQEPRAGKLVMRHAGLLRKSPSRDEDFLPLPLQAKQRKAHGMIEYSAEDEEKIIKSLITDMNPSSVSDSIPGLPAHILFMCIRHVDHMNDDRRMQSLLINSMNSIRNVIKKNPNLDMLAFWLANTLRLLHDMKQYSGDRAFQVHNTPEQNEHCLKNFDLTEYRQVLSDLSIHIYQDLVKAIWDSINGMIVPGILEYESIPGVSSSKPYGGRSRGSEDISVKRITKKLSQVLNILNAHCVDPEIIKQCFRQVFYYIGANLMNNILLRKDMCHWSRGMQIRFNLSQLEDWVRVNQLEGSGIVEALECITQATQLLQVNKKTLEDVDAICEVCSALNTLQVQKILSMYTPANEYEARVPSSVIRAVVERGHNKTDPMYLMLDTAYLFPVTLPFTPSAVSLETINIPELPGLDFLKVV